VILGKVSKNTDVFMGVLLEQCTGTPTQVEVDFNWILKRDAEVGDVIGFFHTHPSFLANPSSLDDRTMDSWVTCLGKNLLSVIQGIDGIYGYLYYTDPEDKMVQSDGPYTATLFKNPLDENQIWIEADTNPEKGEIRELNLL
jgi:hypothetical protein